MEKRLIIAIVLSILVISIFQILFQPPKKTQSSPPIQKMITSPAKKEIISKNVFQKTISKEKKTIIETEKYILTFTNKGGSLKDIKLKEYTDSNSDSPLHLIKNIEKDRAIFSMESETLPEELSECEFILAKKSRNEIAYTYSVPGKFKLIKEYYFHNTNDYIELRISVQNLGDATIYRDYALLGASGLQPTSSVMGRRFIEINSIVDGKIVRNTRVKNGDSFIKGIVSWTGVKERYFSIILKPQQDVEGVILKQINKTDLASGIKTKRNPIYPGTTMMDSYILYIGPNDIAKLSKVGFGLEQIINYGIFGGISKFLLIILRMFYKIVRNWGIAIILLTFLINITLFPLTKKSFLSMRKIQEIQPHIEKLRNVHKDNPQKLNKELAAIYREYNINPLGGCLPLLIQMPIFIALYQGLIRSIELKGANFLWIKDLSNPDFVRIPFNLPFLGNEIHILPLLMVGAMFFQQKISTKSTAVASKEQQQQQKFMMAFFPLFFGFLFYNFPSGLVLYWLTNTILMVIEHSSMRRSLK
ncbi:MAG: membrane protein insertase YidC [Candidatus Omnitrophota bacterium]|nr:MAG: membrane protein insertase YidC [Candidatus Omnitrophota bacterium]